MAGKSQVACRFTLESLFERGACYLWTFTFREAHSVSEGFRAWGLAQRDLVDKLGFRGVRVAELHPGGHGLHIHVVALGYYDVDHVRYVACRYGFGRINVSKRIKSNGLLYVTKYLSKERLPGLCGRRLWATVGGGIESFKTRVRDVQCHSLRSRCLKAVRSAYPKLASAALLIGAFWYHNEAIRTGNDLASPAMVKALQVTVSNEWYTHLRFDRLPVVCHAADRMAGAPPVPPAVGAVARNLVINSTIAVQLEFPRV